MSYYERVFALKQFHKWGIDEIESLMPWELEIYMNFIANVIKENEMKARQRKMDSQIGL